MFASFHAAPGARIGGCLLEREGGSKRERGRERKIDGKTEGGNVRCQPPEE